MRRCEDDLWLGADGTTRLTQPHLPTDAVLHATSDTLWRRRRPAALVVAHAVHVMVTATVTTIFVVIVVQAHHADVARHRDVHACADVQRGTLDNAAVGVADVGLQALVHVPTPALHEVHTARDATTATGYHRRLPRALQPRHGLVVTAGAVHDGRAQAQDRQRHLDDHVHDQRLGEVGTPAVLQLPPSPLHHIRVDAAGATRRWRLQ